MDTQNQEINEDQPKPVQKQKGAEGCAFQRAGG